MSLMTEEELATALSRLEQQELDCQTGSGTVPGKSGLLRSSSYSLLRLRLPELRQGLKCLFLSISSVSVL